MTAPTVYRPSISDLDPDATLTQHRALIAALVTAARSADGLELGRIRVPSAALNLLRMPLGVWFLSLSAHEHRHLEQARAVRSTPGFGELH